MHKYKLTIDALYFLQRIPKKHAKQIIEKIEKLSENTTSIPSKQLEGFPPLRRIRSGEYRIIYRLNDGLVTVLVLRVGKRNDGEVYKHLEKIQNKSIDE
jgi:mRNA interferase RelE/StbE